ncbi:MAG: diphosphomevalonate decarboxylase [Anaerolineaceae bacterium]
MEEGITELKATAVAHPNIAFIKYWGNRDVQLRLPLSGSLSMCLDGLLTSTCVCFDRQIPGDSFCLNGIEQSGEGLVRVSNFLDHVRQLAGQDLPARVNSVNSFPSGAGIASSASAFAALALAASHAIGLRLEEQALSRLARLGSGSACRSVPGGYVEWLPGTGDLDSYAVSIAPPEHWDLLDLVVILDRGHKQVGSSAGHDLAQTSPLNNLRLAGASARLEECKQAILRRDFERLAPVVEADSQWMHAVMRTSTPSLIYTTTATETVLRDVKSWRKHGHAVCATVDAGPNVHVLAQAEELEWAQTTLRERPEVLEVMVARPGDGAQLVEQSNN